MFIPLVALVLGIGIAFWSIYWDHQRRRLQYEERRLMIEKGIAPPPMIEEGPKPLDSSLRAGIILLFLGVGLVIAALFPGIMTGARGLAGLVGVAAPIVLLLGVGNLVYYVVAKRKGGSPSI
jgi:Domain of unknown function (DUF6249)